MPQAHAQDANIACLHRQLNALGFDAGDADGEIGKGFRLGMAQLIADNPSLAELKSLTVDNAITWCHEIGLLDPEMKQYWPTASGDHFEFIFADEFNDAEKQLLVQFADKARNNLKRIDIELAGRLKIIVGREAESLAEKTHTHRRYPRSIEKELETLQKTCNPNRAGGFSEDGFFVVCVVKRFDFNVRIKNRLQFLMVHEITHEAQRQISGYLPARVSKQDLLERYGPHWLIEGTASAMVEIYIAPKNVGAEAHVRNRRNWQDYTREILQSYEIHVWPTPNQLYRHGTYATHLLAQKFTDLDNKKTGHEIFTTYWRQLARDDWKTAFETSFSMSVDDFYAEFK